MLVSLISLLIVMIGANVGWSYQEVPVDKGGTIQGHVRLVGEFPRPMAFNLVTIPDAVYCGRISTGTGWRIVEDFIVGSQGQLKDAVVMVKGIEQGKPFSLPKVEIEAIDCDFLPFVNVLRDQDELTVINMDPVEHDIQGYETARERGARVLFNRPLPMNPFHRVVGMFGKEAHTHLPGEPMIERIHLRKGRNVFVMQCGFHPYMFSWGVVLENPYYSISKDDGAYEIKDIPAGEYEVAVWHPGMKTYLEKTVLVEEGKALTLDFQYESPQGRRSVHEMQDNPRFGLELLEEGEEIVPSLRRQIP
ncbi:MAG: carboxypeptidase-like regulatory domain-containing protein [Nitrospirota bacterium]|nr:carboxypeptidase-like regulatory domain-containing protein [Nitrospirota bacterium]